MLRSSSKSTRFSVHPRRLINKPNIGSTIELDIYAVKENKVFFLSMFSSNHKFIVRLKSVSWVCPQGDNMRKQYSFYNYQASSHMV